MFREGRQLYVYMQLGYYVKGRRSFGAYWLGLAPRCELIEARLKQWYDCNKDRIMAIAAACVPKRPSTAVFRGKPWTFFSFLQKMVKSRNGHVSDERLPGLEL